MQRQRECTVKHQWLNDTKGQSRPEHSAAFILLHSQHRVFLSFIHGQYNHLNCVSHIFVEIIVIPLCRVSTADNATFCTSETPRQPPGQPITPHRRPRHAWR